MTLTGQFLGRVLEGDRKALYLQDCCPVSSGTILPHPQSWGWAVVGLILFADMQSVLSLLHPQPGHRRCLEIFDTSVSVSLSPADRQTRTHLLFFIPSATTLVHPPHFCWVPVPNWSFHHHPCPLEPVVPEGQYLAIGSLRQGEPGFEVFSDCCGVNIPTMAEILLPAP